MKANAKMQENALDSIGASNDLEVNTVLQARDPRFEDQPPIKRARQYPISKIVPDPNQPRKTFDEDHLARMIESVQEYGILSPIRIRWRDEMKAWTIIFGENRWRAASQAGLTHIPAIEEDVSDEKRILAVQMIENCLRTDLNPVEKAKAIVRLMDDNGWSQERAAANLDYSSGQVSKILRILKLDADEQIKVANGETTMLAAYTKVAKKRRKSELTRQQWTLKEGTLSFKITIECKTKPEDPMTFVKMLRRAALEESERLKALKAEAAKLEIEEKAA